MLTEGSSKSFKIPEVSLSDSITLINTEELTDPQYPIHHNLRHLSHSGVQLFHNCPRKFELTKLSPKLDLQEDEHGHLSFGTVVGNGVQEFLVTKNLNRALFRVFLDWKESIDEDKANKSNKTFWYAINSVSKFPSFYAETYLGYELAYFQDKPAVELGFDIDCGDGFHYRGKIDALLIHKVRKEFLVVECKTTGYTVVDEAMYKNSGQALGYGLVIDRVAYDMGLSNNYYVSYPVYKTRALEWKEFRFPKSPVQRATWLQSLLIEAAQIAQFSELGYFPTHGESCFSFNRQCKFFDICQLSNDVLIGDPFSIPIKKDKKVDYPFKFDIRQLIEAQLQTIQEQS